MPSSARMGPHSAVASTTRSFLTFVRGSSSSRTLPERRYSSPYRWSYISSLALHGPTSQVSPTSLLDFRLAKGTQLNAWTHHASKRSLRPKTEDLAGLTFGVKANICVESFPADACSGALKGFVSPYDATVVERVLDAGGEICGVNNMDEFGMGSDGRTSIHGPVMSPYGPQLSPGGSSSGGAAAVASGDVDVALGSDTGGSVRLPAAHCGVFGFKPTTGLLSRYGLIAYASSLDTIGIISRSVMAASRVVDVLRGEDERDATSLATPAGAASCYLGAFEVTHTNKVSTALKGLRVGVPQELLSLQGIHPEIRRAWRETASLLEADCGASVRRVSLPSLRAALPAYYVLALAEASSNLARYDGVRYGWRCAAARTEEAALDALYLEYSKTRSLGFGLEVQKRLLMGALALSAGSRRQYYDAAEALRERLCVELDRVFENVDVLLLPTSPSGAVRSSQTVSGVESYLDDVMTVPASLAGLPAASVPVGLMETKGLLSPIGMQVVGPRRSDDRVLRVSALIERLVRFDRDLALHKERLAKQRLGERAL